MDEIDKMHVKLWNAAARIFSTFGAEHKILTPAECMGLCNYLACMSGVRWGLKQKDMEEHAKLIVKIYPEFLEEYGPTFKKALESQDKKK